MTIPIRIVKANPQGSKPPFGRAYGVDATGDPSGETVGPADQSAQQAGPYALNDSFGNDQFDPYRSYGQAYQVDDTSIEPFDFDDQNEHGYYTAD